MDSLKNVGAIHKRKVGRAVVGRGSKTDSSWQNELPYKEDLELLRMGSDLPLEGTLMRQAFKAGKAGDWAEFLER